MQSIKLGNSQGIVSMKKIIYTHQVFLHNNSISVFLSLDNIQVFFIADGGDVYVLRRGSWVFYWFFRGQPI
jgi:hypothetical protein